MTESRRQLPPGKFVAALSILVSAACILIFFVVHIRHSVNVPQLDDYEAVLYFLTSFIDSNTFSEKLLWLVTQHREHRYVFPRVFLLLYNLIAGEVSFRTIIFFGLAALCGLFAMLSSTILKLRRLSDFKTRIIIASSAACLLFSLQYWEGSMWAIASFFFFFGLLFSVLSLAFLCSGTKRSTYVSVLFAILAVLTSGNGLLLFFAGIIPILSAKKSSLRLIKWTAVWACIYFLYFIGYVSPADQTPVADVLLHKPLKLAMFFSSYLGSVFAQIPVAGYATAIVSGSLMLAYFLFLILRKYYLVNALNFSFMLFLILTMFASSLARVDVGFISRYKVFSLLLLICVIVSIAEIIPIKLQASFAYLVFAFSVCFNAYSYYFNMDDIRRTEYLLKEGAVLSHAGDYSLTAHPDSSTVRSLLNSSSRLGIYSIPEFGYSEFLANDLSLPEKIGADSSMKIILNNYTETDKHVYLNGWAVFGKERCDTVANIRLVLKNDKGNILLRTEPMRKRELTEKNSHEETGKSSFTFAMLKDGMNFPPGEYELEYLVTTKSSISFLRSSGKRISLK